jgi:hypothetical protein
LAFSYCGWFISCAVNMKALHPGLLLPIFTTNYQIERPSPAFTSSPFSPYLSGLFYRSSWHLVVIWAAFSVTTSSSDFRLFKLMAAHLVGLMSSAKWLSRIGEGWCSLR